MNEHITLAPAPPPPIITRHDDVHIPKSYEHGYSSSANSISGKNDLSDDENGRKRHRRKFLELSRDYICPVGDCRRPYASNHSLKLHMRLKHMKMVIGNKVMGMPRPGGGPVFTRTRPNIAPNGSLGHHEMMDMRSMATTNSWYSPDISSEEDYTSLIPKSPKEFENMSNEDLFSLENRLRAEDGQLASDLDDITRQLTYLQNSEKPPITTGPQIQHLQTSREQIWERKVSLERTLTRLADTFQNRRLGLSHTSPHPPNLPPQPPHLYSPSLHPFPHASPSNRFPSTSTASPGQGSPFLDDRRWSKIEAVKPGHSLGISSRLAILPDFVAQTSPVPPEDWTAYCDLTQRHSQLFTAMNHAGYQSQRDAVKKFADFGQAEGVGAATRARLPNQESILVSSLEQEMKSIENEGVQSVRDTGKLPEDYKTRYEAKLDELCSATNKALERCHTYHQLLVERENRLKGVATDRRGSALKPEGSFSLIGANQEEIGERMQTAMTLSGVIMEEADSALTQRKLDCLNDNHAEIIHLARILSHKLRDQISLLQTAVTNGDQSITRLSECYHEVLLLVDAESHAVKADLQFADAELLKLKGLSERFKKWRLANGRREEVIQRLVDSQKVVDEAKEKRDQSDHEDNTERPIKYEDKLTTAQEALDTALLDTVRLAKEGQMDLLHIPNVKRLLLANQDRMSLDPLILDQLLPATSPPSHID
eukprot:Ihof_evm1s545 gene=Ihof_evmTU1s545